MHDPPLTKDSKTDDPTPLCSAPPPLYFLTSPLQRLLNCCLPIRGQAGFSREELLSSKSSAKSSSSHSYKKPSISIVWSLYCAVLQKLKCCSLETVTSQVSTMLEPVVQASFQSILFTIHDLILMHKVYRGLTDLINKIGSTDLIRSHIS